MLRILLRQVSDAKTGIYRTSRQWYSAAKQPSTGARTGLGLALFGGGLASGLLFYQLSRSNLELKSTKPVSDLEVVKYANEKEIQSALDEIRAAIGDAYVNTNYLDRIAISDSKYQTRHRGKDDLPSAIVKPGSTEDVSKVLKIASKYIVPVVPLSGATSLEGHFIPVYGGITLDLCRMDKVLQVHEKDLDCVVQPGVSWEAVNEELNEHGLMFGTDAGPVLKSAECVRAVPVDSAHFADGTVIKTKGRPRKTIAGYSLNDLFIGSEGTLGVITEITLKLCPVPSIRRVGLLTFDKISDVTETVHDILLNGLQLDTIELMDAIQMRIVNEADITEKKFDVDHTLLLRFAGSSEISINSKIDIVKKIAKQHHLKKLTFVASKEESDELWSARKNALWSMLNWAAPKSVWTTDQAVPISSLSQAISASKQWLDEAGLTASIIGHVGDGNFHAVVVYDPKTEYHKTEEVVGKMIKRAIELDGTCTGEHGIGVGKRHYLVEEVSPETVAVMRQIKSALDPYTILNSGKVFQTS